MEDTRSINPSNGGRACPFRNKRGEVQEVWVRYGMPLSDLRVMAGITFIVTVKNYDFTTLDSH